MRSRIRSLLIVLAGVGMGLPQGVVAQDVIFGGQVRPRFESKDLGGDATARSFTSMRVRADLKAKLEGRVGVFVQIQDVRIWGEETSTLADFSADNLDLHQGYLTAALGRDGWLTAKVGRQETNLGGQRLVGAVGWTQQGRSFDGVTVSGTKDWGTVSALAYKLVENSVHPESYGADAFGVYGTFDVSSAANLDLFAIHNRDNAADKTAQTTLGSRLFGAASGFTYRGEFNLQTGERAGSDVSAYLFGARVGRTFNEGRTQFTLWYDYLSGDADPTDDEVKVFDTLFATNHKFYGFADLFLNIPVHTGGLGLQDMAVKATHRLSETVNVGADFHRFTSAQEAADGSLLGHEVDVSLGYRFAPSLRVSAGFSQVWAEDNLINLGRAGGDVSYGYIMMDARF